MKGCFKSIGCLVFLIIIAVVAGVLYFGSKGTVVYKESQAYVDEAIPAIVSGWDGQALVSRATPEFIDAVDATELARRFAIYRTLGSLQDYKDSERQAKGGSFKFNGDKDKQIAIAFEAWAEFDAGEAQIKITVAKQDNEWKISDFNVYSTAFPEQP